MGQVRRGEILHGLGGRRQAGGILLHSLVSLVLIILSFVLGYIIGKQRAENKLQVAEPTSLEDILKRELSKQTTNDLAKRETQLVDKVAEAPPEATPALTTTTAKTATSDKSATSRYTLQLGSFKTSAGAEKLQQELKKKSVAASVQKVELEQKGQKGVWWRVQVGNYANEETAKIAAKSILQKTGKSSLISKLDINK